MRYIIDYMEDLNSDILAYDSMRLYSLRQIENTIPSDYSSQGRPINFRENCSIRVRCIETNETMMASHLREVAILARNNTVFGFTMGKMKDGRTQYFAYALDIIDFKILSCLSYKGSLPVYNTFEYYGIGNSNLHDFKKLARFPVLLIHENGIVADFDSTVYSTARDFFNMHTVSSFIRNNLTIEAVQKFPILSFGREHSNKLYVYEYADKNELLKILVKLELSRGNS